MDPQTLVQELRPLLEISRFVDQGTRTAAVVGETVADQLATLLQTPLALGAFFRLALETVDQPRTSETTVLLVAAVIVYTRVGGLTGRQAALLIETLAARRDGSLETLLATARERAGGALAPTPRASPPSAESPASPVTPAPLALQNTDEMLLSPAEAPVAAAAPAIASAPADVDGHSLALLSWATLHATRLSPLADRVATIGARLAAAGFAPGTLSVQSDDGIALAACRWGDGENATTSTVAEVAVGTTTAKFSLVSSGELPELLQESVKALLRALLRETPRADC